MQVCVQSALTKLQAKVHTQCVIKLSKLTTTLPNKTFDVWNINHHFQTLLQQSANKCCSSFQI